MKEGKDDQDSHPTILETEETEIPEIKPPNEKIISYYRVEEED